MRFDVTLPGSLLRFAIEAESDREAIGTALRIAREQHDAVRVHDAADGRLVADTSADDFAVPVERAAGARGGPELAPRAPTSSPETPEKG